MLDPDDQAIVEWPSAQQPLLVERRLAPSTQRDFGRRKLWRTDLPQVSYHSPSLAPGNTPYVRTAADLDVS
jgi:hypothetical protein